MALEAQVRRAVETMNEDILDWACRHKYGIEPPWTDEHDWRDRTAMMALIEKTALQSQTEAGGSPAPTPRSLLEATTEPPNPQ